MTLYSAINKYVLKHLPKIDNEDVKIIKCKTNALKQTHIQEVQYDTFLVHENLVTRSIPF